MSVLGLGDTRVLYERHIPRSCRYGFSARSAEAWKGVSRPSRRVACAGHRN